MRRFCRFLLLTGLFLGLFLSLACADIIKDFSFTPLDHAVELTFSVKDTEKVVVHYTNSLEKGKLELSSADGHFSGTLSLPATYPGNNVAVTVKTPRSKELLKKTYVQTALEVIPLEEKAESGRLSGVTVCVDPGHQGVAIGLKEPMGPGLSGYHHTTNGQAQGVYTRRYESVVVLEVGQKLRNALLREGADVVMTREDQQTPVSNVRRAEIANEAGADLFIRLHCDANKNKKNRGISVFMPLSSTYAKQVADTETYRTYGDALLAAMLEKTGVAKGFVRQNNNYVASNWAKMPAFLVEMGYMSNEEDDKLLSDPVFQENIIAGMVEGLIQVAQLRGLIP